MAPSKVTKEKFIKGKQLVKIASHFKNFKLLFSIVQKLLAREMPVIMLHYARYN